MRAVLVDPAFLGDVVFDGPFARAFRSIHPGGELGIVVRPPGDGVARRMLGIDRVHVFDKRGLDRGLFGLLRVARDLASHGYDVAYVPHPSARSAMLAAQAGIPRRIGSSSGWVARRFLTDRIEPSAADTFVEAKLRLLGVDRPLDPGLSGTLRGTGREGPGGPARVGLALGSNWETKRWDPSNARALSASLIDAGHRVLFVGADAERPLYRAIPGEDRLGGSVESLIDEIAGLDVLVAGDTGPLHMARALGVPVVALFGPTPITRHGFRLGDRALSLPLACSPCSAHGDHRCPEGHHACMKDLGADRVLEAVRSVIESRTSR
jgi:ADP-heptose:LPS heptosyltransferase